MLARGPGKADGKPMFTWPGGIFLPRTGSGIGHQRVGLNEIPKPGPTALQAGARPDIDALELVSLAIAWPGIAVTRSRRPLRFHVILSSYLLHTVQANIYQVVSRATGLAL